ncbi:MAG: hypothetical protein LBK95_02820 [Bifidobacteriaceae bacterium]|nr:hypothetical protein [Bifidobacteriaceae bacterium]
MTTVPIDHASADLREVAGVARGGEELVLTDHLFTINPTDFRHITGLDVRDLQSPDPVTPSSR